MDPNQQIEGTRPNSPVSSLLSQDNFSQNEDHNPSTYAPLPTSPQGETISEPPHKPSLSTAVDEKDQHKTKTKRSIWTLGSDSFLWEILAIALATGLLVAIVSILARLDRHPQPTWERVSLNSLISWLSTIAKGCVLFAISESLGQLKWVWFTQKTRPMPDLRAFDAASRGFYGSAALIWSLRARHFAACGSLAVILAIAFDPFTQNLIHYYPNLVPDISQTAIVSNNSMYSATGLPMYSALIYVDSALKANVYNAMFSSDSSKLWSIPQYTCSSGNCTWEPIAALEASASCTNVTDRLKYVCYNDTAPGEYYRGPNCSVILPGSNISANFIHNTFFARPVSVAVIQQDDALIYKDAALKPIQLIAQDGLISGGPFALWNKWQAMECAIAPIVRSFRAAVTRGVYHEETLATWTNGSFASEPDNSRGYYLHPPWGPDMGMEYNKSFTLASLSIMTINYFFTDLFTGQAQVSPRFGGGVKFIPQSQTMYAGTDFIQEISYSNITGCTVETAEKLQCAMNNVAAAMTKTFRDTTFRTDGSPTTTGQAMSNMTYVAVHWHWIALPVLVWLLGVATLMGTMWKCRRASVPKWKNDVMPLLFLYRDSQNDGVSNDEKAEDGLSVRLYKSNDGKTMLSG